MRTGIMRISIFIFCGLLIVVTTLTAQTQPVTTLGNAELFSRQYAQADTIIEIKANPNFTVHNQNVLPRKRRLKKSSIFKTTLGSAVCEAGGFLVGGGIGMMVYVAGEGNAGDELGGLGEAIIGSGIGAIIGCGTGTYIVGKKYRKGKFWHALAGTILPSLTVAGVTALVSDKNKYNLDATLYTFALAPITSTAAYYIFSEELPDTVK